MGLHFEHPVNDVEELTHRKHINKFFRNTNLDSGVELGDNIVNLPEEGLVTEFALEIIKTHGIAFEAEGVPFDTDEEKWIRSFSSHNFSKQQILILVIYYAHSLPARHTLHGRLKREPEVREKLGFKSENEVPSSSTIGKYDRASKKTVVKTNGDFQSLHKIIKNVACRVVWAAVRNGITLPNTTVKHYEIDLTDKIDESKIPYETIRYAQAHSVHNIITRVAESLTFHRKNPSYTPETIFGVLAQLALTGGGPTQAYKDVPWHCDTAGSKDINSIIKRLDMEGVDKQFKDVHRRFFNIVKEEFFSNSNLTVAFDPTLASTLADNSDYTIDSGSGPEKYWVYPILSIVNQSARFALSVDLAPGRKLKDYNFEEELDSAQEMIDVDFVLLDAEFHSSDIVSTLIKNTESDWIIAINSGRLSKDERPEKTGTVIEPYHEDHWDTISLGGMDVNGVWYKIEKSSNKKEGNDTKQLGYLTSLQPDEVEGKEVYATHNMRDGVETTIGQIKDSFMAQSQTSDEVIKLFYIETAVLFYNIYVLLNRWKSPNLGLRLNPTPRETLRAIRDVCLGCGKYEYSNALM